MKALLCGDLHLADRAPSVRRESYPDEILAKLEFCVETANSLADVMILLGDVWHVKDPVKTSHGLVQRTAAVLEKFKGRVLIVPGNHDLRQDRLESLESQPLGTLALSPGVELLDGLDAETGVYGIPYLDSFEEFKQRLTAAAGSVLIAAHASIFPPGDHPPYPHMNADELAPLLPPGSCVAYGHIHQPHSAYKVGGSWFCNFGAISRGSLHEETLNRTPRVAIFDSARSRGSSPTVANAFPEVAV